MTTITTTTATQAPGRHRDAARTGRGVAPLSILRRVVRVVTGAALALAALASVALAAIIGIGHVGFSPVLSPSMQPAFAPGDLIVTKPLAAADIEIGQIVVLPRPDAPGERYVHRVIAVTMEGGQPVVQTKGDANTAADSFKLRVTSDTVPVVVGTVPGAGNLAVLMQGGAWRAIAIAAIGLCLLVGVKRALLDR